MRRLESVQNDIYSADTANCAWDRNRPWLLHFTHPTFGNMSFYLNGQNEVSVTYSSGSVTNFSGLPENIKSIILNELLSHKNPKTSETVD